MPTHLPTDLGVTVVIPAYNRATLITRTLESIRGQSRQPSLIIIVDDQSTDDTVSVSRAWAAAAGMPLIATSLEANAGPGAARNRGLNMATTPLIAFLDSDDEYTPETLERLVAPLEAHPEAVLCFGDAIVNTEGATEESTLVGDKLDRANDCEPARVGSSALRLLRPVDSLLHSSFIPTSCTCFRREVALRVGGMPIFRTGEDWLFWLRLCTQGSVLFVPERLSVHHRHKGNLTHARSSALLALQKLNGYYALDQGEIGVPLSADQRKAVTSMMHAQLRSWAYFQSLQGVGAYLGAIRGHPAAQVAHPLRQVMDHPKDVARAIYHTLWRRRTTDE